MFRLTRQQLGLLLFVTLVWGVNWPVMKLGVQGWPPLRFRAVSMLGSVPLLWLVLRLQQVPLYLPRVHWPQVAWLGLFNMMLWHGLMIVAVPLLSSGRAAILGYTMPIFSALLGALLFGQRLPLRGWGGVAAAALGALLLLWNELESMSGRPQGVGLMLLAALAWAVGTQLLRNTRLPVATLTLSFWMLVQGTAGLWLASLLLEPQPWQWPAAHTAWAIIYNAVLVIALAQVAWFLLARTLPPIASTLSVMLIPVLGVFTGALWLGEQLHWQDGAALLLMCLAIASVLWPSTGRSRD